MLVVLKRVNICKKCRANLLMFVTVPWLHNQYWAGWVNDLLVLCPGAYKGSSVSGSAFKASQNMVPRLKVSSNRLGELGIELGTPECSECDEYFLHTKKQAHRSNKDTF